LGMARKLQPNAITLDLGLNDIDGFVLLDLLKHDPDTAHVPIHVISGVERSKAVMGMGAFGITEKPAERAELVRVFESLHDEAKKQKPRRRRPKVDDGGAPLARAVPELAGAKVLIVDDDIRNIFSLTSVLESHDVEVLHAERGKDGILILEQTPGVDVALIDIMMPDMDGYQTMREIRRQPGLANLPLIAVTAKAMKGDRQKCLDAGASDYIAKPVDIELLLALLRVWVARSREVAATVASPVPLEAAE
jgi:CheY-like chemotaxis protein